MDRNSPEHLIKGDTIIRICPCTKSAVLAIYQGNDQVLDLHNPELEQDTQEAINFIKHNSKPITTMKYNGIFALGFNELFNIRLRIMFSTNDLAWYARERYNKEYHYDPSKDSFRQLNLATNQPISEVMREVQSEVLQLAEFTKQDKIRIARHYLLQNKAKMETIFHTSVDLKELPEELQTLLNTEDPTFFEDIIDRIDNLISQVLNTPTVPYMNKYLVYIPELTHPDIRELLERFNKSFQQHQRKLKSLQPAELEHFVFNEAWDLWFRDKSVDIVNTAKAMYRYLYAEQSTL